jgi:hypothetical protein
MQVQEKMWQDGSSNVALDVPVWSPEQVSPEDQGIEVDLDQVEAWLRRRLLYEGEPDLDVQVRTPLRGRIISQSWGPLTSVERMTHAMIENPRGPELWLRSEQQWVVIIDSSWVRAMYLFVGGDWVYVDAGCYVLEIGRSKS